MGLSASQGRLLLLTARRSDLEFRAQQISQKRLVLSQQLEQISLDYENATSNRQMKIGLLQENGDGTTSTSRTANLTYATLVSGTVAMSGPGAERSGIQVYSRTDNQEYSSSTAYRLVSADGAIVVSSEEEIPLKGGKTITSETNATKVNTTDGKYGLYKTTKTTPDSSDESFSLVPKPDSDLYKILGNDKTSCSIQLDRENGMVKYTDGDGKTFYFDMNTGAKAETDADTSYSYEECTMFKTEDLVPKSTSETLQSSSRKLVAGSDGVHTLYELKEDGSLGAPIQRYLIDSSLKYGTTDVNGVTDGPNYLQDCLRNGKYLIEKYVVDENVDEGYRWSSVSWDATANISDSYYTEDDDAAKAKYDRLQTQIQAQDKKLELELDNIETQRNAVTTEVESVEKVISEDIEGTFNAFG